MNRAAFIYHEDFIKHDTGKQSYTFSNGNSLDVGLEFENFKRVIYIKNMLEASGLLSQMAQAKPIKAMDEQLLRVHSKDHIDLVEYACKHGFREVGPEAYVCSESEHIARLSAGGAIKAVDSVLETNNDINQAYALIRPPGHHAGKTQAMGFCIYNNAAIAAEHALNEWDVNRVAIVDWDVHHGNGTQEIFYDTDEVLVISIHEENYFPLNSGAITELGANKGYGFNVNLPLPAGTGNDGYVYVFEKLVAPILREYQADLIIVSAGQDPNALDPLSRMKVMHKGFRAISTIIRQVADEICDGKLAVLQEGGYSLPYLPIATLGVVEGLLNMDSGFEDPHVVPQPLLTKEFQSLINRYRTFLLPFWPVFTQKNFTK